MFALCVESSHARGMGHVFRAINLALGLRRAGQPCTILVNGDPPALRRLEQAGLTYATVNLNDADSDWEGRFIEEARIRVWINDRHDTDAGHAAKVSRRGVRLATFDDRGGGAAHADLNVVALAFDSDEQLPGRKVLRGLRYLVLNPDVAKHRRLRHRPGRTLVTLGGTDTHGVTITVVHCLRAAGRTATVIVGPGFLHDAQLSEAIGPGFEVKRDVPSLVAELEHYDLAITGGGITPFEANASGLPCIVIANEPFEIPNGRELARLGSSVFAGYHTAIDESVMTRDFPLEAMSRAGLEHISLDGADRVASELMAL